MAKAKTTIPATEEVKVEDEPKKEAVKANVNVVLPTYSVEEFASAPNSLGVSTPDIIRAAFKVAGKDKATIEEAKNIINKFKLKEVK